MAHTPTQIKHTLRLPLVHHHCPATPNGMVTP